MKLYEYLAPHWPCFDILDLPFIPIPKINYHGYRELLVECYRSQPFPEESEIKQCKEDVISSIIEKVLESERKGEEFWSVRVTSYAWAVFEKEDEDCISKHEMNRKFENEGIKVRFNRSCGEFPSGLIKWDFGYVLYEVIRI